MAGLSTRVFKQVKSTLHMKVPSILSKIKTVLKVNKPASGRPTKTDGPQRILQLLLIKQNFLKMLN